MSEEMIEPLVRAVEKLREDLSPDETKQFDMLVGLMHNCKLSNPPESLGLTDGAVRAFLAYMHELSEIHDTIRLVTQEPRMPYPDLLGIAAAMLVGFELGKRAP